MIIGFCGRMRSGKTTLADICENQFGFTKLSFAIPLKALCSQLMGVSLEELDRLKNNNTEINLTFTEQMADILAKEVGLPLLGAKMLVSDKVFRNVRDLLQFVGTDIIRMFDKDWHVKRVRNMIEEGKNYVFDDVRFPNEMEMIKELGGNCWFVIRPDFKNISHHVSEESIAWRDCWPNVIVNDTDFETFQEKWKAFMTEYDKSVQFRSFLYDYVILDNPSKYDEMKATCNAFFIHQCFLGQRMIKLPSRAISFGCDDTGTFTVMSSLGERIETKNPLEIEDLKKYI